MENKCPLCGVGGIHVARYGYALPMYEGKVDYKKGLPKMVCKECHDKHEPARTKSCEYCKDPIPSDKYRCNTCHYAYTRGFENGMRQAKREVGRVLRECLRAEAED